MNLSDFVSLSEFLLGIPFQPPLPPITNLDPDLAQTYLQGLTPTAPQQALMTNLLNVWTNLHTQQIDLEVGVQTEILANPELGPMARQLMLAWYSGFHPWFGGVPVPDPANYEQALVWVLAQAHPMGVPLSFGYWQYQPQEISGQ